MASKNKGAGRTPAERSGQLELPLGHLSKNDQRNPPKLKRQRGLRTRRGQQ